MPARAWYLYQLLVIYGTCTYRYFWRTNGDNTVQGYGQKICLKSAILDFPGRNLQKECLKNIKIIYRIFSSVLYNISSWQLIFCPNTLKNGIEMASFLSNYKSHPCIVFNPKKYLIWDGSRSNRMRKQIKWQRLLLAYALISESPSNRSTLARRINSQLFSAPLNASASAF